MLKGLTLQRQKQIMKPVLTKIDTAFAPGKMCLVLGPPHSGKSSMLKSIADILDSSLDLSGSVSFNGVHPARCILPRIVSYTPQVDNHTAVLTVRETLDFAFDCTCSKFVHEVAKKNGLNLLEAKHMGINPRNRVDVVLHYLGLEHCKDTVAGDGTLRGLSGGEKKRLTIAEKLVGTPMVHCMDEITTGLDSSAAFDIIETIRNYCQIFNNTTIISLLQPTPDVVNLFDEVLVLGEEGTLVYHGPVAEARGYFNDVLGFSCPASVPLADFLVFACTDEARNFWDDSKENEPPTCREMSDKWKRSKLNHTYILPRFQLAAEAGRDPQNNPVNMKPWTDVYGASFSTLLRATLTRAVKVKLKNVVLLRGIFIQRVVQSVLIGTIFWQTSNAGLKISMLFMLASILSMSNMYIVDVTAAKRGVFYKHKDSGYFPTWLYTTSEFIVDLPVQVLEVIIIGLITFFFIGFEHSTFPIFFVGLLLVCLAFTNVFKAITAHTRSSAGSHGMAIGFAALCMCFSGYMVTKSTIPDFFIWIYWIVPTPWILKILALNEFKSPGKDGYYDQIAPGTSTRRGDVFLTSFSIPTESYWIWVGCIYIIALVVVSQIVYTLGLHYRRLEDVKPSVVNQRSRPHEARPGKAELDSEMRLNLRGGQQHSSNSGAFAVLEGVRHRPPVVTVLLKNLGYSVEVEQSTEAGKVKQTKQLINQVNAVFEAGKITALMGASGAGKTTLMDVIAGRKTYGSITGEILINGYPQDLKTFARISGYVEQTDIHLPAQTVLEALRFSAVHRLPREMTCREREDVVQAVVDLVELHPILNKMIGVAGAGLSVEQMKRVTIAVEMAANPSVLFLDEPTSGLDTRAARVVIRVIRRIAAAGRTVICTVHQPSQEIFSMFDNLLLLKKGGWVVYNGDMGPEEPNGLDGHAYHTSGNMIRYFEAISPVKCEAGDNPAEYMLDVIGAGINNDGPHEEIDFAAHYQQSEMERRVLEKIENLVPGQEIKFEHTFAAPLSKQLYFSARRWIACYWRTVGYNFNRILVVTIIAFLFSLNITHLDLGKVSTQSDLQSYNGILFAGVFFTCAVQTGMAVAIIGDSKLVMYKELAAGMYSPLSFIFGLTVAEIPWLVAIVFLHTTVFYPLAGLWPSAYYIALYCISLFLFATTFCFWGQMLAALLPNTQTASLVAGPTVGIMVLFCGFFMPVSVIPWPWKLFYYVFPARYGLKAIIPRQFYCSLSCIAERQDPSQLIFCNSPGMTVWDYWSITTQSNVDDSNFFMLILIVFIVGFRTITFLALKHLKHIKR
ncbi:hypothetical protein GUITHDRAFT_81653 [Guillardia theta CCMP2712]|uniref:ABC transporter domain-containing protein n=1 Tax=Guillardia theta (strain CCMP2712) TaxID=905079 RepID=L1IAB1_GUITC|nr:hypothetical protein GUITHDRAFT_81653 [Guillardia theta CCMP2712]EKX33201.1 hypothetical protein GUITHDRAFT_81653 [Guillardia theta CCMP2712]|eukprot:XP_005820181.1 hypothetical protein GUITHDRAFT_81653 [Guillardia theta CCMP2712]